MTAGGSARRATTRRIVMVLAAVAAGLALLLAIRWAVEQGAARRDQASRQIAAEWDPERLNVVLITIDTLRADRLSCYGGRRVETPHLDALAREGIRFANAASTVPFTLPAHSSLMTGTYPPYHGVRENVGYFLDDSLPTLAERLAAGGWTTAAFVSAFVLDGRWGIGRGFDTYFDDFELEASGPANLGAVQRDGRETIAEAVRWLDDNPGDPFFLWLHLFDPHDPYTPPEPFRSRYPGHPYDAEVAYTDSLIGEFRRALERRGLLERSLLVLTGDHGEGLGQHREGFHGFFVYDSTVRVPLIVRLPAAALAGRVVEEAVSHVDLLSTLLEATAQPVPDSVQGASLLPLLLAPPAEESDERLVYSESLYPLLHYGWAPLRSLRGRRYKFIDAPQPELYDLLADPLEQRNILLDERRTSRRFKDALDAMVERLESGGRQAQPADLDEETLRQLQALGYVAGRGGVSPQDERLRDRPDPKDRIQIHQVIMSAQSDLGAGDLDRAEAKLRKVLDDDPELLDAHQMLGSIAGQRGDFESSLEHYRDALRQQSDHPPAIFGLANAYRRLGRDDEALAGFQRLLQLDPADTKAALAAQEILLRKERRAEAIAVLEAATASSRPAPILFSQLGELLTAEGQRREAEELFRRALAGNYELVAPRFNLAVLCEEDGRIEEAMRLYEETVERAPEHFQALFNLGRLHGLRGDSRRQEELYQAAIDANPEFIRGYYLLAKLLMDEGGDLERAEELARAGLEKDADHRAGPLGYFVLADILNRRGRLAEAQRALAQGRRIQAREDSP